MPERPTDQRSVEHTIDQLLREGRLSRRRFIGRMGAAGVALSSASAILAACGTEGTQGGAETDVSVTHEKTELTDLNFSNWPLYIDRETIPDFEQKYGIKVNYVEEINDLYEFFGKVREQLAQGDPIDRDIVVLTDWLAGLWIEAGYVEPIDKSNIPNVEKNLQDSLRSTPIDPERNFTVPWQSGMDGIGYNPKLTGRKLTSVNDLFDPAFKGRVSFLSDWHDSVGLVLQGMGINTEDSTLDDVLAAIAKLDEESQKGQIRAFTGNNYTNDLVNGNLWAAVAYSGDIVQLQPDNPDLEFLIPEEGGIIWSDNMMIPQKAEHPYAAELMMNYVYDPEVAARISAYNGYVSPVVGAQEVVAKTDPQAARNELIFPSDETRAKLHPYPPLTTEEEREAEEAMAQVVGA